MDATTVPDRTDSGQSPWLKSDQAAARAQVAKRTIYAAVNSGRLRAARIGDRRTLRFRAEWVDSWLESCAPQEIKR